jgi:hypothetical protein
LKKFDMIDLSSLEDIIQSNTDSFKFNRSLSVPSNNESPYISMNIEAGKAFTRKVESPVRIFKQLKRIEYQNELNVIIGNLEDSLQEYYALQKKAVKKQSQAVVSCSVPMCSLNDFWEIFFPLKNEEQQESCVQPKASSKLLDEIKRLEDWFNDEKKRFSLMNPTKCLHSYKDTFQDAKEIIPSLKKWHKFSQLVLSELIAQVESERVKMTSNDQTFTAA